MQAIIGIILGIAVVILITFMGLAMDPSCGEKESLWEFMKRAKFVHPLISGVAILLFVILPILSS